MKRGASVVLWLVLASLPGFAQETGDGLNEQQRLGRQIFAQSCGVCHLRPALNVRTYGPLLSKAASGGDEGRMRNIILEGTTRMPAFKYYLAERSDRRHHCLREDRATAGGRGSSGPRSDATGLASCERDSCTRPEKRKRYTEFTVVTRGSRFLRCHRPWDSVRLGALRGRSALGGFERTLL